jgi:hypothetical protein
LRNPIPKTRELLKWVVTAALVQAVEPYFLGESLGSDELDTGAEELFDGLDESGVSRRRRHFL